MSKRVLLPIFLVLIGARQVLAQQAPPTFMIERSLRGGQIGSPSSSLKSADWLSSSMKDGFLSGDTNDESIWCPAGSPNCAQNSGGSGGGTRAKLPNMAGQKVYNFPSLVSSGSFADLRMGVAPLNLLRTTRTGPTGIENMALALTEPSVQKADVDSAREATDFYTSLAHSLQSFVSLASGNPETQEWVMQALNSCITRNQTSMPTIQAVAHCLYDREVVLNQGVATLSGPGFKLSDHPDILQASGSGGAGSSGGATKLCLDDLTFNRAYESTGTGTAPNPSNNPGGACLSDLQNPSFSGQATATDLRKYVNSRIGCFCNNSNWDAAQTSGSGGTATGDQAAARQLDFTFTAPPLETNQRTRLQQDFYNNFEYVYNNMQTVMLNYCTSYSRTFSLSDQPLNFSGASQRFWEGSSKPNPEQIRALSMEGFSVDPPLLEAIFSFFVRSKLQTAYKGIAAQDCNQNFGSNSPNGQLANLLQNAATAPDYVRLMFKYSEIVARGQYLNSLQVLKSFLTSVPANAWVRGKIYENYVDKIDKAARISPDDKRDIGALMKSNVDDLKAWRRDIFAYLQSKIGAGGKNVTGHIKSNAMGDSPGLASGPNGD